MGSNSIKNILSSVLVAITVSTLGCQNETQNDIAQVAEKPKVVASHNVICDLVNTVAQDTIDLTCLIAANQDPHTFRPTPSQQKAMVEAKLILYGGNELEPRLIKLIEATRDPATTQIALYEQAVTEPILIEHEHLESDSTTEKLEPELEPDPHVWHNIENTVAIVELLRSILTEANPSAATVYSQNSTAITNQLWQLDSWIKQQIETIPEGQRTLVTNHESFNYYVQGYNLAGYKTLQGLSSDTPTASEVRDLVREIQNARVPTIFVESTKSDRTMKNVARTANVALSPIKLNADGLGGAKNYTEMMSHNTCAIVNGLGGECQPFAVN